MSTIDPTASPEDSVFKSLQEDPIMTINEVAEMFAVKPLTVRAWIKAGKLKAVKFNNHSWKVRESEVKRYAQLTLGEN